MLRRDRWTRVVAREFRVTVTRPGFLIATLALPLLPMLVLLLEGLVDPERMLGGSEPARVAVVDRSGHLDTGALAAAAPAPGDLPDLPDLRGVPLPAAGRRALEAAGPLRRPDVYLPYTTEARARTDLLDGRPVCAPGEDDQACDALTGYVVVPEDWLETGRVETYRLEGDGGPLLSPFGTGLDRALGRALLAGRLPAGMLPRALDRIAERRESVLDAQGVPIPEKVVGEEVRRFLVPVMAALLLMVALFSVAGYLLVSLSEEKENRVLELLLASLTPEEILAGKLVGIGAAGLLQFSVWLGIVVVPVMLLMPLLGISAVQIVWAVAFFLAGYALFGALMLGVGAVADTARHAQQLSGAFTLIAVLPMVFNVVLLQDPSGTLARVLTFFPLTAPLTAMFRLATGAAPAWELALALAVLVLAAAGALVGAARIFRMSLLAQGGFPGFRALVARVRGR